MRGSGSAQWSKGQELAAGGQKTLSMDVSPCRHVVVLHRVGAVAKLAVTEAVTWQEAKQSQLQWRK